MTALRHRVEVVESLDEIEHDIGVAVSHIEQPLEVIDAVEQLGVRTHEVEELRPDLLLLGLDLFSTRVIEHLATPHTARLIPRRVTATPRTLHRPDLGRLVALVDIDTVHLRDLGIRLLAEHRDVASRNPAPADPTVMVLDIGLVEVLRRQIRRRRLPEVPSRHGPRHPGAVSGLFEELPLHPVTNPVDRVELRPQRRLRVIPARMVGQPPVDVRDARNDERRPRPRLLVLDRDLQPVLVVTHRPHSEAMHLARPRPQVERERDIRLIPAIMAGVDHRPDLLLPPKHVRGVRCGIVRVRVRARDPVERRRRLVTIVEDLPEHPERDPVVTVVLLVLVRGVDVPDESLGGGAVLERAGESAGVFGESDEVPEELLVALLAPRGGLELQLFTELGEGGRVRVTDVVAVETGAEFLDTAGWVAVRHVAGPPANPALSLGNGTHVSGPSPGIIPFVPCPKITRQRSDHADTTPHAATGQGGVAA